MRKMISLVLGLMLVFAASASAAIIVDDWTLDLSGVDGLAEGTIVEPIGQITFQGVAHNEVVDNNGTLDPGDDIAVIDGVFQVTSFLRADGVNLDGFDDINDDGQITFPPDVDLYTGLNDTYQMTFDFSIVGANVAYDPVANLLTFTHLEAGLYGVDGYLDIWIDNVDSTVGDNAFSTAVPGTGAGFMDGKQIARFIIQAGEGGTFNLNTFNGSDDATFLLDWALPGVLFDADGNDLSLVGGLLALNSDSDYDANPQNISPAGFNIGSTGLTYPNLDANWIANTGFAYDGFGSFETGWYAEEDGSARISVVPEPSTFLLLGAGLFGLGIISRKRVKK